VLPGRGMGLVIGRVFSTPYGFRSNSPFEYDNFTLSNLGNGWALNLPWLGSNYLHLTDGQAYPYKWSGSTFQVNNATDFKLVHNRVSVTDALSRVRRYEYNNGINRWLVTGIIYPTLGGTTYAYGSAPVGTDVTTDYVTSRNIYSSKTLASLSQSISTSYTIA